MSEFGNFLRDCVGPHETVKDLAKRLGIDSGMLSRFIRGERKSCNQKTLEKMCARISPEKAIQLGLQAAYLRDQRVGPVDCIQVTVNTETKTAKEKKKENSGYDRLCNAARAAALDESSIEALTTLVKAIPGSPKLRRVVKNIADIAADTAAE